MANVGLLGGISGASGQYLEIAGKERAAALQKIRDRRLAEAKQASEDVSYGREKEMAKTRREHEGGLLAREEKTQARRDKEKRAHEMEMEKMKRKGGKGQYTTGPEGEMMYIQGTTARPVTQEVDRNYEPGPDETFDEEDRGGLLASIGPEKQQVPFKGSMPGKDNRTTKEKEYNELVTAGWDPAAARRVANDTARVIKDPETGDSVMVETMPDGSVVEIGRLKIGDKWSEDSKTEWVPKDKQGGQQQLDVKSIIDMYAGGGK